MNNEIKEYFSSKDNMFKLFHGDTFNLLKNIKIQYNMVFSDPPYFLSNDGLTFNNGKITSVNKGQWDKSHGAEFIDNFNYNWLSLIKNVMSDNASIWISGTKHNIFNIGDNLNKLGFKILNIIVWEKPNPPQNFSKSFFNFSTELIIWAKKDNGLKHYFNYDIMTKINNNKQMKDVWRLNPVEIWEKQLGKHPTQKPLSLLSRIILASTNINDFILDPFTGSSTTGIAANLLNRNFHGIDENENYLKLSVLRKKEIEDVNTKSYFLSNLKDLQNWL